MTRPLARAVVVVLAAASMASFAGCSSDSPADGGDAPVTAAPTIPADEAPVLIDRIRPAVDALERELGGPQQYFEINATVTLVNLFVAIEGGTQAVAYVYGADGSLQAADPAPASGPTFAAVDMVFDEQRVMAPTVSQLPSSTFLRFAITGGGEGGVAYSIIALSSQGTEFAVLVGPTGAVLGTDGLDVPGSVPDQVTTANS